MMRVVVLSASAELGGTERVLIDLARHSAELGMSLTVVVPRPGPLQESLEGSSEVVVVPAPEAALSGSQRGMHLLRAPVALAALHTWRRRVKKEVQGRHDLVYATGFKPYLISGGLGTGPVVWHLHEHLPKQTGPVWRWLARSAERLIANSSSTAASWTGDRPGLAARTLVIHNGVDLDAFRDSGKAHRVHDELGLDPDDVVIGMPAVLARWKGQVEVVKAFRRVVSGHPRAHLVLVGGSIYDTVAERSFAREIDDLMSHSRNDRVHKMEFKEDLDRYFSDFDAVVHYSLRPEPFGRVVLEAMASGVPVIAAAEGGPLEILDGVGPGPGTGGWLCEPRDTARLAEALDRLLSLSAEARQQVGAEGRRRAEEHFSSRQFAAGVAAGFRRVLAG